MKREHRADQYRKVGGLLFVLYVIVLCYYMFFAEDFSRDIVQAEYHYNLVPFQEIKRFYIYWESVGFLWAFLNIMGNVLCFLPFGFLLPVVFSKSRWSAWKAVLCGFGISLLVETLQLIFKIGVFDVDDLLLNTVGAWGGYVLYYFGKKVVKCFFKKR